MTIVPGFGLRVSAPGRARKNRSIPTTAPRALACVSVFDIVPVLLYHSVADDPVGDPRFAVSRATFEQHIQAIEASGRKTVNISDLAAGYREQQPFAEPVMAVTFDDGYADTYEAAIALLDRGLQSTVYITTSEVDARHRLTCSQVAELAHLPQIELGAHAVHHRYLDELRDGEIVEEVGPSKIELEEIAQAAVDSFAYPHGAYDRRVRRAVIEAGYSSAAAVKNATSHAADDPYAIARWTVTAGTSAVRIAQILAGDNVPRAWARERGRTRAYRAVRRGRRRLATIAART